MSTTLRRGTLPAAAVLLALALALAAQAVVCSGSNPQGGTPQIPAQVMCQLRSTTTLIRIKNHVGANVTAPVRIILFGDFGAETPPTTAQATFQHPHQVG